MKTIAELAKKGRAVVSELSGLSENKKNQILLAIASTIESKEQSIITKNKLDVKNAADKGLNSALIDRLTLNTSRIKAIAQSVRDIAGLEDPTKKILEKKTLKNGLVIEKISVPIGVIGIIYESRPNVTVDAAALCFKSGNVVILKGGSDAINSNSIFAEIIQETLEKNKVSKEIVQFIKSTDRESVKELLAQYGIIDLIIPRGGEKLIEFVSQNTRIPILKHDKGVCSIYIDKTADKKKAIDICINAKVQRPGVCNAAENIVIHKDAVQKILADLVNELKKNKVEVRGDKEVQKIIKVKPAAEKDFFTEYLDLIISIKIVNDLDEAILFINTHDSGHSEAIITEDKKSAEKFLALVDAAAVYHNASTRFTDGGEFGMGAEMGISTQKIHARGPVGVKELTTYKFVIRGNGQIRN